MHLPTPPPELYRAMRHADFADTESMRTLETEVTRFARALRAADAPQSRVLFEVRGLVDDALPTRLVPLRTSEDRARLLALAERWCAVATP